MANKKISQLFENPYPKTGDIFPIVQDGVTYKLTLDNLFRLYNNQYNLTHTLDPYIIDDLNNYYGRGRFISGNLMISGSGNSARLPHAGSCVLRVYDGNFILNGSGIISGLNSGVTDLGHSNSTQGLYAINIGQFNISTGVRNEVFGSRNNLSGAELKIFGDLNLVSGSNSKVFGTGNRTRGVDYIVFGDNNLVNDANQIKIYGNNNTAELFSSGSFIVGKNNYVGNSSEAGANSLVYGDLNKVSGKNSLVFGRNNLIKIKSGALEKISVYGLENDVSGIEVDVYGRLNLNSGLTNQIYGHSNTGFGDINFTLGAYNKIERLGVESYLLGDYINLNSGSGNYMASRNVTINGNNNHVVGQHLNVFGTGNWVAGNNSAITGIHIIAVGKNLNLDLYSNFSNVFGRENTISASGYYSDVYGSSNTNSGQKVIILGKDNTNTVNGYETTILGRINDSYGEKLFIVGERNIGSGFRGYIFGYDNDQNTFSGYTIGEDNLSSGSGIYIFGLENIGTGRNSEIFGANNQLSGNNAFIFGTGNISFSSHNSNIYGNTNTLNAANHSHAFGSGNQITNTNISVAYGNGNSLSAVSRAHVFGSGNIVSGNDSATFGYGNRIGSGAVRTHTFGYINTVNSNNAIVVGTGNLSDANQSATFGGGNTINSTAIRAHTFGFQNTANSTDTTVVGRNNTSSANDSAIFGHKNTVNPIGVDSYTLGLLNTNNAPDGYILGKSNTATGSDSYTFGRLNNNHGERTHVDGRNNSVQNVVSDANINGNSNTIINGQAGGTSNAGIIGNNNSLASDNPIYGSDSSSFIYGNNSTMRGYSCYSFGSNNTTFSGASLVDIFGSDNNANMDENNDFPNYGTVIFGKTNNFFTGVDNGIFGTSNIIRNSSLAFVYGRLNTVSSGLNNVVVLGKEITIPKSGNAGYKLNRNDMNGAVQIGANNSGKITILENGNIGFGTSGTLPFENPQELIHVRSGNVLFDATEGGYFKFYDKNRYDNQIDNPSQVDQPGDIRAIISGGNFKIDGDLVLSTGYGETGQFLHGRIFQEASVRNLDGSMWCYAVSDLYGNCGNTSNPYNNSTEIVTGTDGTAYTHKIGLWQPYGFDLGWDTPTTTYASGYVSGFIQNISTRAGAISQPDFCNGDCNFDYQPHEAGRIGGRAITFLDGNPTSAIITGRYTLVHTPIMKTTNLYLPPVAQNSGVLYTVKNLGKGNIMVFSTGSEKIDLFFTGFLIDQRFASYEFLSNGSGWFLV